MSDTDSKSAGGIGCLGVLLIVFVVLKLTNNIDWSWWWVTAPLWAPIAIVGLILIVTVVINEISR